MKIFYKTKGFALLLTLLCISLLGVIGMGLVGLTMSQSRIATNHYLSSKAFYVAYSGIERAMAELEKNPTWAVDTPYTGSINIAGLTGTYTVSVNPSSGNSSNTYKVWYVTSIGTFRGAKRTISAVLETEALNSGVLVNDYALLLFGDKYTQDKYSGPIHTNRYFYFVGKVPFDSPVTSSNKYDSYYDESTRTYTQGGKTYTDPAKFYHYYKSYDSDAPIAAEGSGGFYFAGGRPVKSFPNDVHDQRNNANLVFNTNVHVTFLNGGQMKVVYGSPQNPHVEIYPTDNVTLYTSRDIYVKGELTGNVTLVSNRYIWITDNVTYSDKSTDSLSLIARRHIILYTSPYDHRDIHIDAMMYALSGTFYVWQYWWGVPRGKLYLYGGLNQKFNIPSGLYDASGNLRTGYIRQFAFDPRFLSKPPLNVPVTGKVRIKAWKDKSAIGS